MKYSRILLTPELIFDVKKTLKKIKENKKETQIKDIGYDFILTICKLWTNNYNNTSSIKEMTNEILCLTEHYFKKQSGGGKDLIIYEKEEEEEEEEEEVVDKFSWGKFGAIAQAMFSCYLLYSTFTRTHALINDNIESLHKIEKIIGPEIKAESGMAIMDVFDQKLEEAQLITSSKKVNGFIQDTRDDFVENFYLPTSSTNNPHAISVPSYQGLELIDKIFPNPEDLTKTPIPVFCETFTKCLFDMATLALFNAIKSIGYEKEVGDYFGNNLLHEIDGHTKGLKDMISGISENISKKVGWSIKDFRKEYPELDKLMIKLENPSKESIQEVVTNILYGYDQGWLQLSQLLGVVEDIPFNVASKIQDVLIKKRSKIKILSDRTLTNTKEIIKNSTIIFSQLCVLFGCLFYLRNLYKQESKKKSEKKYKRNPNLLIFDRSPSPSERGEKEYDELFGSVFLDGEQVSTKSGSKKKKRRSKKHKKTKKQRKSKKTKKTKKTKKSKRTKIKKPKKKKTKRKKS